VNDTPGREKPAREELDAALESFRRGWLGVIAELAEVIEAGAELPDAASLEGLYESSLPALDSFRSVLEELRARLVTVVGGRNARELRLRMTAVGSYAEGWIEGGGVAIAVMRDLPNPLTQEAVADLLTERMAFVVARAEHEVGAWLAAIDGAQPPGLSTEVDEPSRQERFEQLLARATALGVRVRNAPDAPSDGYLRKLALQLDEVERKRVEQQAAAPERARRLKDLLFLAERMNVRIKVVPTDPSDGWLDRMEQKLREVAQEKGFSDDAALAAARAHERPTPDQVTRIEPEMLATSEAPRPAALPIGPQARLALLVERAESAGFDLGRVPANPSSAWLDDTEGRLDAAIAVRRQEMHAERGRREAERKERLARIVQSAAANGLALGPVPAFPTDDWLDRMELRLSTSLTATPSDMSEGSVESVDELLAQSPSIGHRVQRGERPRAFLVFEEGTVQERIWPVDEGAVTLGRGRDNVVQIRDDAGVSRRHATVQRENGSFVIRDEGSTKGTLVDGSPVKETRLAGGERITLGDTEFVFRLR